MPKALDLTGQIFGNLKAISKAPSKGKKTYWLCECLLCGNQKEIQTSHIISGASQSCGCRNPVRNFSKSNVIKKCILCGQDFTANPPNRQYCYDCSPKGISAAESLRLKKRKLKHKLIEYKGGKCCKCGYNKCEAALHFHHLNPKEKEFALSQINLNNNIFSLEKIFQEVDKCILLCANCHIEEHYKED